MDAWIGDGDWSVDPWFLKVDAAVLTNPSGRRFTSAQIEAAAEELKRVYPPHVCRELMARGGESAQLVFGLFVHYTSFLIPLLELAHNLRLAAPVSERAIARLRDIHEFLGATHEVEILAALRRARLDVDVEPDMGAGRKGPDFRVIWNYREYFLELKLLRENETDRIDRELHDELTPILLEHWVSIELLDDGPERLRQEPYRRQVAHNRRLIVAAIDEACAEVRRGDRPAADYSIPYLGAVRLVAMNRDEPLPSGLFSGSSEEDENERVFRAVRDGSAQLPARGVGVVFTEASDKADLREAARLLHARMTVAPARFTNLHCAVLRCHDDRAGHLVVPAPGVALDPATRRFAAIITSRTW